MSAPAYTAEELANIDPPPVEWQGKRYTAYEATQKQRAIERAMRKQKRGAVGYDAAGLTDDFTAAAVRLSRQREVYKNFSKTAGLYTQFERATVVEMSRKVAGKTAAVTRKLNGLTNSRKSGIIGAEAKIMNSEIHNKHITNFYSGIRSETPLTEKQKSEIIDYAVELGMPRVRIIYSDHQRTVYDELRDSLIIGTDIMPFENAKLGVKNANQRVSCKGSIAHEIIGHRIAHLKNKTNYDNIYEEAQASIRAARFAKGLTSTERLVLLEDARSRLPKSVKLKDIKHLLYINEL